MTTINNYRDWVIGAFAQGKLAGYNGISPLGRPADKGEARIWLKGYDVGAAYRRRDLLNGTHPQQLALSKTHLRTKLARIKV